MHEVGLMQNMLELIEKCSEEYRLKQIYRIVVRVGELSNVVPEALQFAFEASVHGTIAEKAEFIIETVPARARCIKCGHEFPADFMIPTCPECGQTAIITEGQELHLQSLEGDQEDGTDED